MLPLDGCTSGVSAIELFSLSDALVALREVPSALLVKAPPSEAIVLSSAGCAVETRAALQVSGAGLSAPRFLLGGRTDGDVGARLFVFVDCKAGSDPTMVGRRRVRADPPFSWHPGACKRLLPGNETNKVVETSKIFIPQFGANNCAHGTWTGLSGPCRPFADCDPSCDETGQNRGFTCAVRWKLSF